MSRPPRRPEGPRHPPRSPAASPGGAAPRAPRSGAAPQSGSPARASNPGRDAPFREARAPREAERGPERAPERDGPPRGPRPVRGAAPRGERPGFERSSFERPAYERPSFEKPAFDKAERPAFERTLGERRPGADRRGSGDRRPGTGPAPEEALRREKPEGNTHWLYGLHAVAAALANPRRRLKRLLLTAEAEATLEARQPKPWRVQAERVERNRFQTFLTEEAVHQGAALLTEPLPPVHLDDALAASRGPVLLLDQVTDPRNVGAILRSAAAFGVAAVIMQDRNAPPETGTMARAAVGALDTVPVVREVNLSRAIVTLQRAGYWVMGLDGEAKTELASAKPKDRPVALVLGAEDSGMRRLQRETCDELVRLPISNAVESLNVSVAAAVALYELVRKD